MEWFLAFLAEYGLELGGGAALIAIIETIFKPFRKLFGGTQTVKLDEASVKIIAPTPAKTPATLDVHEFIAIRREMKADLEEELAQAHEGEKTELRARIAEMQSQIDAPDKALIEAQKQIADLTERLNRMGNEVGGDRLQEAQEALAKLDFSLADEIFAEVEERQQLEVQQAARAAFGRGEVAEAEVRWHDAAAHYERAARLDPSFETLRKASEYVQRAGNYEKAHYLSNELLTICRSGENEAQLSNALNEHAINSMRLGHYAEAEAIYREAQGIDEATIGKAHPDYATRLNNLAGVVEAQGRFDEAEALYREALGIDEATIGKAHPSYAIDLNNLAGVVESRGRYEEAEALYREALAIDEATIGKAHPEYAIHLNNLAGVVRAQGRYDEAEALYREALAIDEATIGKAHPQYANHLNNLAHVVQAQGRYEEAESLYRDALGIAQDRLGVDHPDTQTFQANLDELLAKKP